MSLLSVTVDNPKILATALGISAVLFLRAGIAPNKLRIWLGAVLLAFWGTLLSQSLFYARVPRTIVFEILAETSPVLGAITGGINVYREGVEYGLIQGMRFVILLTCGLYVCFTTESKDLLRAAIRLRIPANFSFMVSIALRFVPMIVEEARTVIRAHKLRGFSPARSGCIHPMQTARLLLRPILVNAVRRSSMLSLSVESRHFSHQRAAYCVQMRHGSPFVSALLGMAMAAIASAIIIKATHFLYISNFFYASWLRPLYAIGDKWL
jgi:energy-coupling factor transport system permease protein